MLVLLLRYLCVVAIFSVCIGNVKNELTEAVHNADYQTVKFLLGIDQEILTSRPPVLVNRMDDTHARTALLVCGSDPKNRDRPTLDKECVKIAKVLYKGGANMSHVDKEGWNAVSMGAVRGYTRFCRYLIDEHKVEINGEDEDGRTPLMKAAAHGHFDTFAMLLRRGANITAANTNGNLTAVHFGAVFALQNPGQLPFLRNLTSLVTGNSTLKSASNATAKGGNFSMPLDSFVDKDGRTPLMYAAISNNRPVMEVLLAAGSDPRKADGYGVTCTSMPADASDRAMLTDAGITLTEKEHKQWLRRTRKQQRGEL
jgi:hypothetical protein